MQDNQNNHETTAPEEEPTKPQGFLERKKARRYAMQALYGWHLTDNALKDVELDMMVAHSQELFDRTYFHEVLYGVPSQLERIHQLLMPHVLERSVESLDPIELTILRVAVYELLERREIPYRVVINEALELAKTFGATDGHKFVNGVLDKVAKGIPGRQGTAGSE